MFQWLLASPVTGKVAPSTETGVFGDNQDFGVEVTVCYAQKFHSAVFVADFKGVPARTLSEHGTLNLLCKPSVSSRTHL
jgi:hypothetical protein